MKNIAITLSAGDPTLRNHITTYLSGKSWAYWHWIDDFWIVQTPDDYTPKRLYDELEQLPGFAAATVLILELQGATTHWGRAEAAAWEWMKAIGTPG